jgi:hypothetical protein
MSFEEEHVAHPRLYGAPAYARPPLRVTPTATPIDPDDLPIAAHLSDEEREVDESLRSQPFGLAPRAVQRPEPRLQPQRSTLTARAGRLLGRAS